MEFTDFHTHILPAIDDGSRSAEMSAQMLRALYSQGVRKCVLTSHYYGRKHSPEEFLRLRAEAYEKLMEIYDSQNMPRLFLGAEVAVSEHMCRWDLSGLRLEGTDIILLEMPGHYHDWIEDVMYEILLAGYKPMIAHLDRVIMSYSKKELFGMLDNDKYIYQINNSSLSRMGVRSMLDSLAKDGARFVLGSDSHNLDTRAPDFDSVPERLEKGRLSGAFAESVFKNQSLL